MSGFQLALAVEPGNLPQQAVKGWGTDPTSEAIRFIDAMVPTYSARKGTVRERDQRPIAYLYARQGERDEALPVRAAWADLRFIEARDGDGDIEAEWLRVTGENSTRRTETYGDTRARWKVADHWYEKHGQPRRQWVLDARQQAASPAGREGLAAFREWARQVVDALDFPRLVTIKGSATLATSIQPLVLVAAWAPWMGTAIRLAKAIDYAIVDDWSEHWTVAVDRLAVVGHRDHEAIARATVERASANPVLVRALEWVCDAAYGLGSNCV